MTPVPRRPLPPEEARRLLRRLAPPDERWPRHCLQVARVARRLGEALRAAGVELDLDLLESQALLHDVGRARTHGPLHGWTGWVLLRSMGHAPEGRGCLTHWLKGRSPEEVVAAGFRPHVVAQAFAALEPVPWDLADSALSVADSSVRHDVVVPMAERHADLLERYGDSDWLRRHAELGAAHAAAIEEVVGVPLDELLAPLHGPLPETD